MAKFLFSLVLIYLSYPLLSEKYGDLVSLLFELIKCSRIDASSLFLRMRVSISG